MDEELRIHIGAVVKFYVRTNYDRDTATGIVIDRRIETERTVLTVVRIAKENFDWFYTTQIYVRNEKDFFDTGKTAEILNVKTPLNIETKVSFRQKGGNFIIIDNEDISK